MVLFLQADLGEWADLTGQIVLVCGGALKDRAPLCRGESRQIANLELPKLSRNTRTGLRKPQPSPSRNLPTQSCQDVCYAVSADVPPHGPHDAADSGKCQSGCASFIRLRQN
jgi:hypothetical protein